MPPETSNQESCRLDLKYSLDAEYMIRRPSSVADSITLLLHGFGFSGEHIYHKLLNYVSSSSIVLAPNGPLFAPILKGESFRLGYSWYFWDEARQKYLLEDGISVEFIQKLFAHLKLPKELPMQIIGFSQGAYLAPFIAREFPQTKQIIGLAGRFLQERMDAKDLKCKLYGIHGDNDEIVALDKAKASHEHFLENGCQGEFFVYPGLKHEYHREFREKVKELSL